MDWIEVKTETHQIKNCIWVECIAEIRKNDTGEIREYETHEILEIGDEHPSVFNWEENNIRKNYSNQRISQKDSGNPAKIEPLLLHLYNKFEKCCFFSKTGVAIAPVLTIMLLHKRLG